MIKRILVPVDGSPHSVRAAELASEIAVKFEAEIVLLHVLLRGHMPEGLKKAIEVEVGTHPSRESGELAIMPQEIMARVEDKNTTQLSLKALEVIANYVLSRVAAMCHGKGIEKLTQIAEEGHPAKTILSTAERIEADMIVMEAVD